MNRTSGFKQNLIVAALVSALPMLACATETILSTDNSANLTVTDDNTIFVNYNSSQQSSVTNFGTISGTGTLKVNSWKTLVNAQGGTLDVLHYSSPDYSGQLINKGTLILNETPISLSLNNAGTVISKTGSLSMTDRYFQMQAGAKFVKEDGSRLDGINVDHQSDHVQIIIDSGAILEADSINLISHNLAVKVDGTIRGDTVTVGGYFIDFSKDSVIEGRKLYVGQIDQANNSTEGGTITASEKLVFTNNFIVKKAVVTSPDITFCNTNLREGTLVHGAKTVRLNSTLSLYDDSAFDDNHIDEVIMNGITSDNGPRIQLMGTQPINIGSLTVYKSQNNSGKVVTSNLIDKMTAESDLTSFDIEKVTVKEGAQLTVYAANRAQNYIPTNVHFGDVTVEKDGILYMGVRTSSYQLLGDKRIDTLRLGANSRLEGTGTSSGVQDAEIQNLIFTGSGANVTSTLVGESLAVTVDEGVTGGELAKVTAKAMTLESEGSAGLVTSKGRTTELFSDTSVINVAAANGIGLKVDGNLVLDGTVSVNAEKAIVGSGTVSNKSDLTLKGDVTGFTGTFKHEDGNLKLDGRTGYFGGAVEVSGGTLDITGLRLGANTLGSTKLSNGSIVGLTSQFFSSALATGNETDSGAFKANGLTVTGGTLTMTDAQYNLKYAASAGAAAPSAAKLVFTGNLITQNVTDDGSVQTETNTIKTSEVNSSTGAVSSDVVYAEATLSNDSTDLNKDNLVVGTTSTLPTEEQGKTEQVDQSLAVKNVRLKDNGTTVTVNNNRVLTMTVGNGNIIDGGQSDDLVLKIGDDASSGFVQLGVDAEGVNNGGRINADVTVTNGSVLSVAVGNYTSDKKIVVNGSMSIGGKASATLTDLALCDDGVLVLNGTAEVTLTNDAGNGGNILVGSDAGPGNLTVKASNGGNMIFLDPIWRNGVGIEGATKLVYGSSVDTEINDMIIVGRNSYAVFGDDSDAAFLKAFGKSGLAWGESQVEAAVYLGAPIALNSTNGSLTIDGTLTNSMTPTAISGVFTAAANTLTVADVTALNAEPTRSMITADSFDVAPGSRAVLVNVAADTEYLLVNGEAGWDVDNVTAANAMFGSATAGEHGVIFTLQAAEDVYSGLMQSSALANTAMAVPGEAYNYADSLLTNLNLDKRQAAALFDAAMNPMGALGTFTTAYDRATELKAAVREEAGSVAEPRLWVRVTGGKTQLDGISTGAQSLTLKTEAFGVIAGGETSVTGTTIGAAFSAGTGSTRNNAVAGKDDFNYYGLTAYAQRECAGVTLTADASATWLKSELTVGGAADVDNDADSAVYAIGLEGKKDFEVSGVTLTPFVGLDVYHLRSDSMTTKHGVKVDSANATAVEIPIGARAAMDFTTTDGTVVKPAFSLAVVPTLGDRDIDVMSHFVGAKSNMNFTFADDVQIRSNLGITAEKKNVRFGLDLGYNWGNEERSALSANVKASFLF